MWRQIVMLRILRTAPSFDYWIKLHFALTRWCCRNKLWQCLGVQTIVCTLRNISLTNIICSTKFWFTIKSESEMSKTKVNSTFDKFSFILKSFTLFNSMVNQTIPQLPFGRANRSLFIMITWYQSYHDMISRYHDITISRHHDIMMICQARLIWPTCYVLFNCKG